MMFYFIIFSEIGSRKGIYFVALPKGTAVLFTKLLQFAGKESPPQAAAGRGSGVGSVEEGDDLGAAANYLKGLGSLTSPRM